MVLGLMDLKDGNMRRSFPNRNGCVGYAVAMYLLSVICAWSCNDVTVWKSRKAFMSVDDVAKTENTKKLACFEYIFLVKQLDTVFIVYNVCHRLLTLNDCFSLCLCLCLYFYLCLSVSLTCFEDDDSLETGELRGIDLHFLELGDDLLQ